LPDLAERFGLVDLYKAAMDDLVYYRAHGEHELLVDATAAVLFMCGRFDEQEVRDDAGDVLDGRALTLVTKVMEFGARKYEADSWKKVRPTERYLDAALRHLLTVSQEGWGALDGESGLPHLAHAACSLLFALWQKAQDRKGNILVIDDPYVPPVAVRPALGEWVSAGEAEKDSKAYPGTLYECESYPLTAPGSYGYSHNSAGAPCTAPRNARSRREFCWPAYHLDKKFRRVEPTAPDVGDEVDQPTAWADMLARPGVQYRTTMPHGVSRFYSLNEVVHENGTPCRAESLKSYSTPGRWSFVRVV
jgi:hypothetical protein